MTMNALQNLIDVLAIIFRFKMLQPCVIFFKEANTNRHLEYETCSHLNKMYIWGGAIIFKWNISSPSVRQTDTHTTAD